MRIAWPSPTRSGLALVLVLMAQIFTARASDAATTVVSNPAPIAIPDAAAATTYPSTIAVAGVTGTVVRVNVTLTGLSHGAPDDLDILLVGPGGQTVLLMSDTGRDAISNVTLTFDDAGQPVPKKRIGSGTFRPTNSRDKGNSGNDTFPAPAPGGPYGGQLAAFNGVDPNGSWRLFVRDDHASGTGTLAGGWCLTITTDQPGGATGCTPTLTVATTGQGIVTSAPAGITCGGDCTEAYPGGTAVTLTAAPAPSFTFAGWSGGGCSGTAPCVVTVSTDVTVTATFAPPVGTFLLTVVTAGSGSVTSAPTGIVCGADCVEAYADGTAVTLTATPAPSFTFTGWSGGGCAGTAPCVVTVSADVTVTATFAAPPAAFTLTVTTVGSGTVTSAPVGIDCGADCVEAYSDGTAVTLTATPAPSFTFGGWSGGGCSGTAACVVTLSADVSVTATFTAPPAAFTLTVTTQGDGTVSSTPVGIDCGGDCAEAYAADLDVTLVATAAPGFVFAGWAGGGCDGTDPCTVTMTEDLDVTAIFAAPPGSFILTVLAAGPGTVTSAPGGITCGSDCAEGYPAGTTVTLTASPAPGFVFAGWSGGGCSGTAACAVVLSQDVTLSATFVAPPGSFALTVILAGSGAGTVTSAPGGITCGSDCAEAYPGGTAVVLTASPAPSFVFAGWSGGGCSGTGPCAVVLSADVTISATFTAPAGSFTLAVALAGSGLGTVTSAPAGIDCGNDCAEAYPGGTAVTLTAVPAPSFEFAGWSGGGCSGTAPCTVTLTGDVVIGATFAAPAGSFTLAVLKGGRGLGRVTSAPAGIDCGPDCADAYPGGAAVTLSAVGRRGSTFGGWSGGGCGGQGPCVATVSADTPITATFDPPADRPLIVVTEEDDPVFAPGGPLALGWIGPPGTAFHGFEFTAANRGFANPLGAGPDPVSGFGGAGGGFLVAGGSLAITVPATLPAGVYQVRVIGLSPAGALVGRFSDTLSLLIGALPGGQAAITSPAEGTAIARGGNVAFSWTPVDGAAQYLFEFSGGPDPGMLGGSFTVPSNGFAALVPAGVPPGTYQVRVLGLTVSGAPVGQFSAPVSVVVQ
jgi:subtilisin-like proprotein convertase family protein